MDMCEFDKQITSRGFIISVKSLAVIFFILLSACNLSDTGVVEESIVEQSQLIQPQQETNPNVVTRTLSNAISKLMAENQRLTALTLSTGLLKISIDMGNAPPPGPQVVETINSALDAILAHTEFSESWSSVCIIINEHGFIEFQQEDLMINGKVSDYQISTEMIRPIEELQISKSNSKAFEIKRFSGRGDGVTEEYHIPMGVYRLKIQHNGESNFVVYNMANGNNLLVNEIGKYRGSVFVEGDSSLLLDVTADGSWSATVEAVDVSAGYFASGKGDYTSNLFLADSITQPVSFKHKGNSNFVVYLYSFAEKTLVVNEIGQYEGIRILDFYPDDVYLWEVVADGEWSIS